MVTPRPDHVPLAFQAVEVLNQCAREIEEEERPIIFTVFQDPISLKRVPEPPAVKKLYRRYLRTKGTRLVA
jgi:hypothetical protein